MDMAIATPSRTSPSTLHQQHHDNDIIMAARTATRAVARPSSTAPFLDPKHQQGLTSILSQTYGKPVTLKLHNLNGRHQDVDLLAQTAVQQLKDRRNQPRRIIRDAAWKSPLPTQTAIRKLQQERLLRENMRKPVTLGQLHQGSVGAVQTSEILRDLNLSQVSSVSVGAAGRLSKRISANRAQSKVARRGATSKGEVHLVKGWQKQSVTGAIRAGKRRIGQYGIRVELGHS